MKRYIVSLDSEIINEYDKLSSAVRLFNKMKQYDYPSGSVVDIYDSVEEQCYTEFVF